MTVNILNLIGKSVVIALCAGGVAGFYVTLIGMIAGDPVKGFFWVAFVGAISGSFAIGLPVVLLTFWMAHRHLIHSANTLAMIVVLSGIMLVLASFVVGDEGAVVVMGVPAFLAAITYGVMGWFWILKPMQRAADD